MKVFLDLDGTLIDVAPRHYRVYDEVTRDLGGVPLAQPRYWELKRKRTKWAHLLPLSQLPGALEREYLDRFISKIERPDYLRADRLMPGADDVFASLVRGFDERYLVSLRRKPDALEAQLEGLGIRRFFSDVLTGHSEADGVDVKVALIQEKLGDAEGVVIGDTEADVLAGRKLGMTTIAVRSGLRDEQFLRSLQPDFLLGGIGELTVMLPTIMSAARTRR